MAKPARKTTMRLSLPCGCYVEVPYYQTQSYAHTYRLEREQFPHNCSEKKWPPSVEVILHYAVSPEKYRKLEQLDLLMDEGAAC